MQLSALLPSSPRPRSDALEVFKCNPSLCAFGSLNNAFADRVVYVFGEAALLTGKLLQPPPCGLRPEALEFGSQPSMAIAHVVHHSAVVDDAVRVAGNVGDTKINPKHVINMLRITFLNLARHQQIPLAAAEQQIAFALAGGKHQSLTFATHERNALPPLQCPDRDGRVGQCERENAVIVGDRGEWAEGALGLLVQFVGIADFGKRTNNHLRRQAERLSHILIGQLLKRKFAERARVPRHIADAVTRSVGRLKRAPQRISLLGIRQQLQVCDQLHLLKFTTLEHPCQSNVAARRFLPPLKLVGFRACGMPYLLQRRIV